MIQQILWLLGHRGTIVYIWEDRSVYSKATSLSIPFFLILCKTLHQTFLHTQETSEIVQNNVIQMPDQYDQNMTWNMCINLHTVNKRRVMTS